MPGSGLVYAGRTNVALANALDADVLSSSGRPTRRQRARDAAWPRRSAITARTYRAGERDRVVGAVVNRVPDTSTRRRWSAIRARWRGRELALVGAVPLRPELRWPRVSDAVAGLDVEVLNAGDPDRRVKDVIVAAQAVPGHPAAAARGRAA